LFLFRLRELVDLMTSKTKTNLSKEELLGRQSGSSAWRTARGELGLETSSGTVWRLTEWEKKEMVFHLEYDVIKV
jgi:hypothetical protein